jgi:hypothetical protein
MKVEKVDWTHATDANSMLLYARNAHLFVVNVSRLRLQVKVDHGPSEHGSRLRQYSDHSSSSVVSSL